MIQKLPEIYEWYINEWINLVSVDPITKRFYLFKEGEFVEYTPVKKDVLVVPDLTPILEDNRENLPIYELA